MKQIGPLRLGAREFSMLALSVILLVGCANPSDMVGAGKDILSVGTNSWTSSDALTGAPATDPMADPTTKSDLVVTSGTAVSVETSAPEGTAAPGPTDPDGLHLASWVFAADPYPEEKTVSEVTLEDEFTDNEVIVVLTHEASMRFREYGPEDFPEIDCVGVQDLTIYTRESRKAMAQNEYATSDERHKVREWNQILCIELLEHSKEHVLEVIRLLEQREDMLNVEPNAITIIPGDAEW